MSMFSAFLGMRTVRWLPISKINEPSVIAGNQDRHFLICEHVDKNDTYQQQHNLDPTSG